MPQHAQTHFPRYIDIFRLKIGVKVASPELPHPSPELPYPPKSPELAHPTGRCANSGRFFEILTFKQYYEKLKNVITSFDPFGK